MRRKKQKQNKREGANELMEKHESSPYKKNDQLWFQDFTGTWRWGTLSYFSTTPDGKSWATLWDLVESGFYSCHIESLQESAPDEQTKRRIQKARAKSQRRK